MRHRASARGLVSPGEKGGEEKGDRLTFTRRTLQEEVASGVEDGLAMVTHDCALISLKCRGS